MSYRDSEGIHRYYRSVPDYMFEKTNKFFFEELKANQLIDGGVENLKKWRKIKRILAHLDLETICEGLRKRPVADSANNNPYGYTEIYPVEVNGRICHIGPDDAHKWLFDLRRIFPVMDACFDESLHFISEFGFSQYDGVQIYQDAKMYFEGSDFRDNYGYTPSLPSKVHRKVRGGGRGRGRGKRGY